MEMFLILVGMIKKYIVFKIAPVNILLITFPKFSMIYFI